MSFFLVKQLNTPPSYIGIYTVCTALSGIFFSQLLGSLLDRGKSGKKLFTLAMVAALSAAVLFANAQKFWHALAVGVFLMGVAAASFPILLAMIRRYADTSGKDSMAINSQMRSGVSLVWIVGPTLAFSAVDWFGFTTNFYLTAAICASVIVMALWILPEGRCSKSSQASENSPAISKSSVELWLLGAVMLLGNLANTLYLTAFPLYLTEELNLPISLPGLLMGLTAGLEIPIMLLVPRWAARYGRYRIFSLGFIVALAFYLLLQAADSPIQLIALQLLNGIFFGIFAGLGISLIQDAATGRLGYASAFYTNAMRTGMMGGTAMAGLLAQLWSYKLALIGSIVAMILTLALMGLLAVRGQTATRIE